MRDATNRKTNEGSKGDKLIRHARTRTPHERHMAAAIPPENTATFLAITIGQDDHPEPTEQSRRRQFESKQANHYTYPRFRQRVGRVGGDAARLHGRTRRKRVGVGYLGTGGKSCDSAR